MRSLHTLCFSLALLLGSPSLQSAQVVGGQLESKARFDGEFLYDRLGDSVAGAGDVNGDGFHDLIVGAWGARPDGVHATGSAFVYSGIDGSLLWRFDGKVHADQFGYSVDGAGDVNGDGFADLLIGAKGSDPGRIDSAGSVYVYSGADGSLLWRVDGSAAEDWLGSSVSGAGDVNADGYDDFIIGAWGADPGGRVDAGSALVFSGLDRSLLWRFDGAAWYDWLGSAVAGVGDINRDGFDDLIVGAIRTESGFTLDAGAAMVYSGRSGAMLWQYSGSGAWENLGNSVAAAGDVNQDGFDDFIIGSAKGGIGPRLKGGSAYVYSGSNGTLLLRFDGQNKGDRLGASVAGAGDVDHDGFDDLVVGAPLSDPGGVSGAGSIYVHSGRFGGLIWQFDGKQPYAHFGASVAGAGDVDGDGFDDLLVGAPGADTGGFLDTGAALVLGHDPFLQLDADEISLSSGAPVQFMLDFPDREAGVLYVLLSSSSGVGPTASHGIKIPLTKDRVFHAAVQGVFPPFASGFHGRLDQAGDALATLVAPSRFTHLVGRTIYFAAVSYDQVGGTQAGRLSSVARSLTIVP